MTTIDPLPAVKAFVEERKTLLILRGRKDNNTDVALIELNLILKFIDGLKKQNEGLGREIGFKMEACCHAILVEDETRI